MFYYYQIQNIIYNELCTRTRTQTEFNLSSNLHYHPGQLMDLNS